MNKKKVIKIIGNVILIASVIYIIRILLNFDIDFKALINPKFLFTIFAMSLLLSISVLLNSIAWKKLIITLSEKKIKLVDIFHIYAKANIGKYLPGNFMHYASRNIIGDSYNISHSDMVFSTALEIALKLLGAFLLVVIFVRQELIYAVNNLDEKFFIDLNYLLIIIACIIIAVVLVLYFKNKSIVKKIKIIDLLLTLSIYIFIFIINAFVFIFVAKLLRPEVISFNQMFYFSGIYIIAWLLGYMTPGSPGGIGVRESVMILMFSSFFSISTITLISIIIRLITVIADFVSYFINLIIEKREAQNETNNSDSML